MNAVRRRIIAFFTFVAGLYFFLEYLLPPEVEGFKFGKYHEEILKGLQIISVVTIGLGIINIFAVYGRVLVTAQKGWENSLALIGGFLIMIAFQTCTLVQSENTLRVRAELDALVKYSSKLKAELAAGNLSRERFAFLRSRIEITAAPNDFNPIFKRIGLSPDAPEAEEFRTQGAAAFLAATAFEQRLTAGNTDGAAADLDNLTLNLKSLTEAGYKLAAAQQERAFSARTEQFIQGAFWIPLTSAMFSLLAFFMATAAYRAFRVKSLEAMLIMFSALLVVLGQIPHGPLYISPQLPHVRLWLLENINTPAFRAIYFGSAVAGLAMAIRLWFSLERSPLDGSGES